MVGFLSLKDVVHIDVGEGDFHRIYAVEIKECVYGLVVSVLSHIVAPLVVDGVCSSLEQSVAISSVPHFFIVENNGEVAVGW